MWFGGGEEGCGRVKVCAGVLSEGRNVWCCCGEGVAGFVLRPPCCAWSSLLVEVALVIFVMNFQRVSSCLRVSCLLEWFI